MLDYRPLAHCDRSGVAEARLFLDWLRFFGGSRGSPLWVGMLGRLCGMHWETGVLVSLGERCTARYCPVLHSTAQDCLVLSMGSKKGGSGTPHCEARSDEGTSNFAKDNAAVGDGVFKPGNAVG